MNRTYNAICETIEEFRRQLPKPDPEWPHDVRRAVKFIYEHLLKEGLTVTLVKEECQINGKSFPGRFRKCTGLNPKEFILIHQINLSKRLLKLEDVSIGQAGLEAGFSSHSAFCKTFKRKVGVKPSVWRGQAGNGNTDGE